MTATAHRPNTALLVVDVQNTVVANAYRRADVIANIRGLADRARAENVSIAWVQHSDEDSLVRDTEGWRYVPELQPADGELVVHKRYGDAFEATDLGSDLAARGVGRSVVVGAQTDACIRATLHGAFARGYDTVLVSDAHTTDDYSEYGLPTADKVIAHTNMYWTWQSAPDRTASVATTAEVSFASK